MPMDEPSLGGIIHGQIALCGQAEKISRAAINTPRNPEFARKGIAYFDNLRFNDDLGGNPVNASDDLFSLFHNRCGICDDNLIVFFINRYTASIFCKNEFDVRFNL